MKKTGLASKILGGFIAFAVSGAAAFSACASGDGYLSLPENIDTSFKSYMDYRAITNTRSDQYKLQQEAYTDSDGIRCIGDDVCVAVGTAYAEKCGIRLEITLDSGNSFTAVVGDIKADRDTDKSNRYRPLGNGRGDMIEFIVETSKLDKTVRRMGSIGTYEKYSGNVTAIKVLDENDRAVLS